MATYVVRTGTTTNAIGHAYTEDSPVPGQYTQARTRYYCKFDLSGYAGPPQTFYAATGTADGSITETETCIMGAPPSPSTP